MIWVLTGPEGGGKSSVMTALAITQHNYYIREKGIDLPVFTFPGYEIVDENKKVFSQEIKAQDWVTLPEDMKDLILCIDEAQIFFNTLDFMRIITRLFTNLALQRRHRNITIYMCIQDFSMLSKGLRFAAHLVSYLWDDYWTQRSYGNKTQRGRKILIRTMDNKGFITGFPRTRIFPDRECFASNFWGNFNTYQITSVFAGMDKVSIKKQEITIKDGQVVYEDDEAEDLARLQLSETVGLVIDDLREKGIPQLPRDTVRELMVSHGINCPDWLLGQILKEHGVKAKGYKPNRVYSFGPLSPPSPQGVSTSDVYKGRR